MCKFVTTQLSPSLFPKFPDNESDNYSAPTGVDEYVIQFVAGIDSLTISLPRGSPLMSKIVWR